MGTISKGVNILQPSHNSPRKGPKFLDTKVFIAALAVAITVGLWNLFSYNAFQPVAAAPGAAVTLPIQPETGESQDFPTIPTLVPLVDIKSPVSVNAVPITQVQSSNQAVSQESQSQRKAKPALRSVTVPTQVIIQKGPVIQQSANTMSSLNSSSQSGGKTTSATTKSSKK